MKNKFTYFFLIIINMENNIKFDPALFNENKRNYARNERNKLLEKTDKYLLNDFPISLEDKMKILTFRQQLRDFMNLDEVKNYDYTTHANEFPELPEFPI